MKTYFDLESIPKNYVALGQCVLLVGWASLEEVSYPGDVHEVAFNKALASLASQNQTVPVAHIVKVITILMSTNLGDINYARGAVYVYADLFGEKDVEEKEEAKSIVTSDIARHHVDGNSPSDVPIL